MTGNVNLDMVLYSIPAVTLGIGIVIGVMAESSSRDLEKGEFWTGILAISALASVFGLVFLLVALIAGFVEGVS